MTDVIALGPGGEADRIRDFWERMGHRGQYGGDDCAIIPFGDHEMAMSVDTSVEGTHFKVGWLDHREMGWRAGAAALSDLAAVAATPRGVLASLGVPPEIPDEFVADIMDGVALVADSVGACVWGGDLYRTPAISITVTVLGSIESRVVLRSGARPEDTVWVTGRLGGAAAAVASLLQGTEPGALCRQRFAHPVPRIAEARWLSERGATSMIDLSDGIMCDAAHVSVASGVAMALRAEDVPVDPEADLPTAMNGGEDYELLFTMPGDDEATIEEFENVFGLCVTRIGRISEGSGVTVLRNGEPYTPAPGFRHF